MRAQVPNLPPMVAGGYKLRQALHVCEHVSCLAEVKKSCVF